MTFFRQQLAFKMLLGVITFSVGILNISIIGSGNALELAQYQATILILYSLNDLAASRLFQARTFKKPITKPGRMLFTRQLSENVRVVGLLTVAYSAFSMNFILMPLFAISVSIAAFTPTRLEFLRNGSIGSWFLLDSVGPIFFLVISFSAWLSVASIHYVIFLLSTISFIGTVIYCPQFFGFLLTKKIRVFRQLKARKAIALEAIAITYLTNSLAFVAASAPTEQTLIYLGTRIMSLVRIFASSAVNQSFRNGSISQWTLLMACIATIICVTLLVVFGCEQGLICAASPQFSALNYGMITIMMVSSFLIIVLSWESLFAKFFKARLVISGCGAALICALITVNSNIQTYTLALTLVSIAFLMVRHVMLQRPS